MDAARCTEDESAIPVPGDLSFCLMCCEASQFGKKMKMHKFDLNSIRDIVERNRLKTVQNKMRQFWEENSDLQAARNPYFDK